MDGIGNAEALATAAVPARNRRRLSLKLREVMARSLRLAVFSGKAHLATCGWPALIVRQWRGLHFVILNCATCYFKTSRRSPTARALLQSETQVGSTPSASAPCIRGLCFIP
jgi:hypothetical protein